MGELHMDIRAVDGPRREIVGMVAPYDETTYLVAEVGGERLRRGCFAKSIRERAERIPLLLGHNHAEPAVGRSVSWQETPDGLVGVFMVKTAGRGDEVLADARDGYLAGLSVGFQPEMRVRAADGASEVSEARLLEVSLVPIPAYSRAEVLAVRSAEEIQADIARLLEPFANPAPVDLTPLRRWLT